MPLFAVIGLDNPADAASKRSTAMAEHRAYLQAHDERIALVGPLRDQNGSSCGSLYIFEAESPTEIHDWLSREPFVRAGVYSNVIIRRFDPVMSRLPPRDWLTGARLRK